MRNFAVGLLPYVANPLHQIDNLSKTLPAHFMADGDRVRRFEREARGAAASTSFQLARAIQRPPGLRAGVFAIFENLRAVDENVFYSD